MSGYENEERKTKFHGLFATKIRISLVKTLILKKTFLLLCHRLDLNRSTIVAPAAHFELVSQTLSHRQLHSKPLHRASCAGRSTTFPLYSAHLHERISLCPTQPPEMAVLSGMGSKHGDAQSRRDGKDLSRCVGRLGFCPNALRRKSRHRLPRTHRPPLPSACLRPTSQPLGRGGAYAQVRHPDGFLLFAA